MFHAGGHKCVNTRGRASGISRHYPNFLNHPDWKAPLRCGILFITVSCILFVIGVILTWLGVHDVFGESVPITGPILLAVGVLMLLLAVRQFYLAQIRKKAHKKVLAGKGPGHAVITAITEQDEEQDLSEDADLNQNKYLDTMDDHDPTGKQPEGYYDHNGAPMSCAEPLLSGGYVWPPVAIQSPYYSMAMMVYKDPALTYGPFISAPVPLESCSAGPAVATGSDSVPGEAGALCCGAPHGDTAVLETTSTTLHQQSRSTSPSSPAPTADSDCLRIFPSDYLSSYQRTPGGSTSPGISSLPNPTAFMMIRTLEVQETI
ncbi:uncharacterized protein LOC131953767 isoform X2 [Physella acuta]|uniref:uncharacterized protein LOC131953767 isoform X2 n=1 Tax=Physella acuta TaxID=109671 RepID=UPI0027DDA893|nr:uncharacterized protein LOC131953767 isoform X2 [Physella acuta]